jgi:hypothetical protein
MVNSNLIIFETKIIKIIKKYFNITNEDALYSIRKITNNKGIDTVHLFCKICNPKVSKKTIEDIFFRNTEDYKEIDKVRLFCKTFDSEKIIEEIFNI